MFEPEIGKTGEVMVEGHVIGRLDGFIFVARCVVRRIRSQGAADAAQKALAGEIDARAARLPRRRTNSSCWPPTAPCAGPARRSASWSPATKRLQPRMRIIADEHLTGAPREAVQARLDRWLKTHIEKLLGPLFGLARPRTSPASRAASRSNWSKRSACWSAEGRRRDEGSRPAVARELRKYGVRFGAYHIYLPALLKPAPRALASLLWALKQDSADSSRRRRRAASGRPAAAPRSRSTRD